VLIITREVASTSTEIAKQRIELSCTKDGDHEGPHHDGRLDENWDDRGGELTHVLRHEGE